MAFRWSDDPAALWRVPGEACEPHTTGIDEHHLAIAVAQAKAVDRHHLARLEHEVRHQSPTAPRDQREAGGPQGLGFAVEEPDAFPELVIQAFAARRGPRARELEAGGATVRCRGCRQSRGGRSVSMGAARQADDEPGGERGAQRQRLGEP